MKETLLRVKTVIHSGISERCHLNQKAKDRVQHADEVASLLS